MSNKSILAAVFFCFGLTVLGFSPNKALAQTCPATVLVDNYKCGEPTSANYCDPPTYLGYQSTQSCSWDGNACKSNNGICSSNDSCSYQEILGFGTCVCTNSPVNCSNPNPPPPGCFLPGTIVNGSSGGKNIEEVRVGDSVDSFADNALTQSAVSQIYKVTREYYYSLVAGDYQVKVTAEHPFFVGNNEFKEVKDLKAGDDVYVIENGSLKKKTVTSNTRINEPTEAYNLSVDNTNTFFANDFAVHNKGNACTASPGGLVINRDYSPTEIEVSWIPGAGGNNQVLAVAESYGELRHPMCGCHGDKDENDKCISEQGECVYYSNPWLLNGISSQILPKSLFEPHKVYYFKVVEVTGTVCMTVKPWISSCALDPASLSLNEGAIGTLTMPIDDTVSAWYVLKGVNFSSGNSGVATVDPAFKANTAWPATTVDIYATQVTGVSAIGSPINVYGTVVLGNDQYGNFNDCYTYAPVAVLPVNPPNVPAWWQTVGGDIHADSGEARSRAYFTWHSEKSAPLRGM